MGTVFISVKKTFEYNYAVVCFYNSKYSRHERIYFVRSELVAFFLHFSNSMCQHFVSEETES